MKNLFITATKEITVRITQFYQVVFQDMLRIIINNNDIFDKKYSIISE